MAGTERVVLDVHGMNCQHCVAAVREKIESIPGVTSVEVSLVPGRAVVSGSNLDKAALRLAIDDLGYSASVKD